MTLILGTDQNDTLHISSKADIVKAGAGDDWIVMYEGNHEIWGGAGNDTISFVPYEGGVHVNLSAPGWQDTGRGWILALDVENVIGSNFTDNLTGNAYANRLAGWGGNDILRGLGGNDVIRGGLGNDVFDGGTGRDAASFASTETNGVKVDLRITGYQNTNEGMDKFISIENLYGSQKNDKFIGNSLSNVFDGGLGNDRLDGGNGSDTLWGGGGKDVFVWQALNTGKDVIRDFEQGLDKIDLDACKAVTGFDFGDLTITHVGGGTQIILNDNARYQITLSTYVNLTASDFIF